MVHELLKYCAVKICTLCEFKKLCKLYKAFYIVGCATMKTAVKVNKENYLPVLQK